MGVGSAIVVVGAVVVGAGVLLDAIRALVGVVSVVCVVVGVGALVDVIATVFFIVVVVARVSTVVGGATLDVVSKGFVVGVCDVVVIKRSITLLIVVVVGS
jgi:hypothetical protein